MPTPFPITPYSLLSQLSEQNDPQFWEISWKRFLELYHSPLAACISAIYSKYTYGQIPSTPLVQDIVATVIIAFFEKEQARYQRDIGRLRTYLRLICSHKVIDYLRKERPGLRSTLPAPDSLEAAEEFVATQAAEHAAFNQALLATMIEDLRSRIPFRRFEIFERVKLKNQSPTDVASLLGITRANIDREIYKTMVLLRELAQLPEYQQEYYL